MKLTQVLWSVLFSYCVAYGAEFIGALPPGSPPASPVLPELEQRSFSLPPGFEIELVASEEDGIGKFVTVAWDLEGRLWSMTALEYPVDANEAPEAAKALYESRAKDKVVIWDDPYSGGPRKARVFAEGLAIPLGILPFKNGVYVQHGSEIVFLSDTDNDGKADMRETILSGFGVQDSHLFPHQFTRAPGNWIWMAQGAFNYGKVRTSTGSEQQFDRTRMARFRYDGSEFDITSQGPCNIWGLVLNAEGEAFIQEANDYGYPVMAFHEYANYPGCSDPLFKSYAPEFPPSAPDFKMGGTGLSGLALSDATGAWPEPYANVHYIANPITRMVQAVKVHRDGPRYRYEKLPDFLLSSDEMFRPVAIQFGPDGCLYIVDWYNKIISHNEVPRNHPERDKKRGRIWRVKHQQQKPFKVPNFMKAAPEELLARLGADSTVQSHMAWQAIGDRQLRGLAPELRGIVSRQNESVSRRIAALWALEALHELRSDLLQTLLAESNRNLRREAVRAFSSTRIAARQLVTLLQPLSNDPDPEVRAQVIRTVGPRIAEEPTAIHLCLKFALPSLSEPVIKSTANGRTIKTGVAYEREFERYLVRYFLEQKPGKVAEFLASTDATDLPIENLLVAALALEPQASVEQVARLLPALERPPNEEELLRLAQFPAAAKARESLKQILGNPAMRPPALDSLVNARSRFDPVPWQTLLTEAARETWNADPDRALRVASSFKLQAVEPFVVGLLGQAAQAPDQARILRAIREIGTDQADPFLPLAKSSERTVREEAFATLAVSRHPKAPAMLLDLLDDMNHIQRRTALDRLAGRKDGANEILARLSSGHLRPASVPEPVFDKLAAVLGSSPETAALLERLQPNAQPVLRLDGSDSAWVESNISLNGPFTIETWIKLAPGIDNNDGILGAPGLLDINFADARPRVWIPQFGDVIIATRRVVPDVWTHLAVTRDESDRFRIFLNGEPDAAQSKSGPGEFRGLRVGWTTPAGGTAASLAEYRVWTRARTADEIRASFDSALEGPQPALVFRGTGSDWPAQHPAARAQKTSDVPRLLNETEMRAQAEKLEKFKRMQFTEADIDAGRRVFAALCQSCHRVGNEGGEIGPVLSGAGAMGIDTLLRAILTPNAAMEAGYRTYRVELANGDILDGFLVSQNDDAVILRQPNSNDQRIPQEQIKRAEYLRASLMPEGLIESLSESDTASLLAYLHTLKGN